MGLERLWPRGKYWLGAVSLALSLQGCGRSPLGANYFPDGGKPVSVDAVVSDAFFSDAPLPDARYDADKQDAGTADAPAIDTITPDAIIPDATIPDVIPPDALIPEAVISYDAPPDSAPESDGTAADTFSSDVSMFPIDSGSWPDAAVPDVLSDVPSNGNADVNVDAGSTDAVIDAPADALTNNPPLLGPIGDYTINEGESLEFIVSASDPDSDALIFGAGNIPAGANFNPATQLFSWTPTYEQAGEYQTTFLVSDGEYLDAETITITVLDAAAPCSQNELLDDFNRPDQNGLGNNALGNPWIEYGTLDDWDIEGNAAVTSYTGSAGANPRASSEVGYRNTFNILLKFMLSEVNAVGNGGAFIFNVNSSVDIPNGLAARLAVANSATHYLTNGEEGDLAMGNQALQANTFYRLRLAYDGTTLRLKLWEDGTSEPIDFLLSAPSQNVSPAKTHLTIMGDQDTGEAQTITIDYIINEGTSLTLYADNDGDGHGNVALPYLGCPSSAPPDYVASSDDCDDSRSTVYPGAPERCDGRDNDCNEEVDENVVPRDLPSCLADGSCSLLAADNGETALDGSSPMPGTLLTATGWLENGDGSSEYTSTLAKSQPLSLATSGYNGAGMHHFLNSSPGWVAVSVWYLAGETGADTMRISNSANTAYLTVNTGGFCGSDSSFEYGSGGAGATASLENLVGAPAYQANTWYHFQIEATENGALLAVDDGTTAAYHCLPLSGDADWSPDWSRIEFSIDRCGGGSRTAYWDDFLAVTDDD